MATLHPNNAILSKSNPNVPVPTTQLHSHIRRTKSLLGKFGQHHFFDPGVVEPPQEDEDGHRSTSPSSTPMLAITRRLTNPISQQGTNRSSRRITGLKQDIFDAKNDRTRLGQNYYGDADKVKLWKYTLYTPPTAAGVGAVKKLVDKEYNIKIWCYELANDTTEIRLVNYHLTSVPLPLCDMSHLTKVDLSENRLVVVPPQMGKLVNLKELNLSFNELKSLPPEIGQEVARDEVSGAVFISQFAQGGILGLKCLDISNNKISEIPHTFSRLADLDEFKMDNNSLKCLPPNFSRWKLLSTFSPHQNKIPVIPHELCVMESLIHLNLSNNKILELPQAIGRLKNLIRLDCSFNKLCQLPASIVQLDKLEVLLLIDNNLELLPIQIGGCKSLKELNLYHNLLEDLPVSMKDLTNVEIVDLDYNPLTQIPALIRDEGWDSVRQFLSSDLLTRRKIKLRDHTQTVGQGVMGKDVPRIVQVRIQVEAKKRLEKKIAKGRKFDFNKFEKAKAHEVLAVQVRTPKVHESTWLLFEGEDHRGKKKSKRKARQTELNRALFAEAAEALDEVEDEDDESDERESGNGSESSSNSESDDDDDDEGEDEVAAVKRKEKHKKAALACFGFGHELLKKKREGDSVLSRKSGRSRGSSIRNGSSNASATSINTMSTTSTARRRRNQNAGSIGKKKFNNLTNKVKMNLV